MGPDWGTTSSTSGRRPRKGCGRPGAWRSPLKEALKSDDVEVQRRAQELVDKFKWGIYADTPAKVVQMIQRYQGGADADAKGAIILELFDAGEDGRTAFARIVAAEDKKCSLAAAASEAFNTRGNARNGKKITTRRSRIMTRRFG